MPGMLGSMLGRMRLPRLSHPVKLTVVGASVGVTLIVVLASYFRRRRRRPAYHELLDTEDVNSVASTTGTVGRQYSRRTLPPTFTSRSPNGGISLNIYSCARDLILGDGALLYIGSLPM